MIEARKSGYVASEVSIPTTVSGGLQYDAEELEGVRAYKFQYRQRYQEGYNSSSLLTRRRRRRRVSIPTTVSGGLQYRIAQLLNVLCIMVSIPTTVSGGLQSSQRIGLQRNFLGCFNTDNGIRRATIPSSARWADMQSQRVSIPTTVSGGLQFLRLSRRILRFVRRFNTGNGIRRATMYCPYGWQGRCCAQFQYRQRYQEGYNAKMDGTFYIAKVFQYRQRYQEGYNYEWIKWFASILRVFQYRQRYQEGYNSQRTG